MEYEFKHLESLENEKKTIIKITEQLKQIKQVDHVPHFSDVQEILEFATQHRGLGRTYVQRANEQFLRSLLFDLEKHLIRIKDLKEREIEEYKCSDAFQNMLRSLLRDHDVEVNDKNE